MATVTSLTLVPIALKGVVVVNSIWNAVKPKMGLWLEWLL